MRRVLYVLFALLVSAGLYERAEPHLRHLIAVHSDDSELHHQILSDAFHAGEVEVDAVMGDRPEAHALGLDRIHVPYEGEAPLFCCSPSMWAVR